ncbi:hypothetical protein E1H12_02950 [Geitlerinema sp. P-1104]|uniref:hypothetical protein n=1 Tax=Geitlerinema sp. P-1104 TaxID=2546230 RepID=UPI001477244C|nr:hypothetical protein [Geitlerinema sp. P-1104]NMG57505.1 hypothetical protein [Geitlerinema sp. P-1104]
MFDSDELTVTQIQGPDDLFDVRGQLLRKTNPLRTKILIFSTIYHQFDFSDRDWMALRTQELDALLRHLFDACPTLDELDSRLHRTARDLEGTEENLQAADLLVRCFTRFYVQDLPSRPDDISRDLSPEPQPSHEPVTLGRHITESPALDGDANSPEEEEEESDSSLFFDMTFNGRAAIAPAANPQQEALAPSPPTPSPGASPRLSDRLLQHLATTDEVQDLIRRSSKDLTEAIAQSITDLEMNLEATCAHVSPEEQLRIKHEAVTSLLNDVRLNLNRIGGVLDHSSSSPQEPIVDELQQQASQGTPRAIARWLIQRHRALGINLLATQKGRCLHVVLDLASVNPSTDNDPHRLAGQMYESILELKLSSADRLKVHGREPGQKRPSWTRSFLL